MFRFKGKSPMEQFSNLMKIWFMVCFLGLASCAGGIIADKPYNEKKSYDATLMNAYSTYKNCGHKGRYECEVFKGRFKVKADGKYYEREVDGFFYNNFIEKGKEPMAAYITLSKNDMGVKSPSIIAWAIGFGFLGLCVFFMGGICLLFGSMDAEEAQRKWERKQSQILQNRKFEEQYGNRARTFRRGD